MTDYILPKYSMISGQGDAVSRPLKLAYGRADRRWLYNDDLPNAGAFIYVEGGNNSDGFGGATIEFLLVDGSTLSLRGPWHSNPDSLYSETGIDLRQRHETFGVIGRDREYVGNQCTIKDVLYKDPVPVEGSFSRIEDYANELAKQYGVELVYYSESRGGSSCGFTHVLKSKVSTG